MKTKPNEVYAVIDEVVASMSVREYVEFLEELQSDIESRLDAARDDLRREDND
jgi:hypothetical protein